MRKIKFRAWDTANKRMDYLDHHFLWHTPFGISGYGGTNKDFYKDGTNKSHDWSHDIKEGGQWILMQYTGFNDKNGKDIYEGDIIKIIRGVRGEPKDIVTWADDLGCWHFGKREDQDSFMLCDIGYGIENSGEVIGNIYENPELLK